MRSKRRLFALNHLCLHLVHVVLPSMCVHHAQNLPYASFVMGWTPASGQVDFAGVTVVSRTKQWLSIGDVGYLTSSGRVYASFLWTISEPSGSVWTATSSLAWLEIHSSRSTKGCSQTRCVSKLPCFGPGLPTWRGCQPSRLATSTSERTGSPPHRNMLAKPLTINQFTTARLPNEGDPPWAPTCVAAAVAAADADHRVRSVALLPKHCFITPC